MRSSASLRIGELPEYERPRERLLRLGPAALTSAELIAILLRTGTAHEDAMQLASRLLRDHSGLRGLAGAEVATLAHASGLGPARAATVAAAFELGRRAGRHRDTCGHVTKAFRRLRRSTATG